MTSGHEGILVVCLLAFATTLAAGYGADEIAKYIN
jgi:hypothetical protein